MQMLVTPIFTSNFGKFGVFFFLRSRWDYVTCGNRWDSKSSESLSFSLCQRAVGVGWTLYTNNTFSLCFPSEFLFFFPTRRRKQHSISMPKSSFAAGIVWSWDLCSQRDLSTDPAKKRTALNPSLKFTCMFFFSVFFSIYLNWCFHRSSSLSTTGGVWQRVFAAIPWSRGDFRSAVKRTKVSIQWVTEYTSHVWLIVDVTISLHKKRRCVTYRYLPSDWHTCCFHRV